MTSRFGVLLLNLGGPERLEDVKPFLYNLFSDPAILRVRPDWLRKSAAWLIASARRHKSCGYYAKIGGGSPLRRITQRQAQALEAKLAQGGAAGRVYVGMRCWKPSIDEALGRIVADGTSHLIVLPLYPQFSTTTTGSALDALAELLRGGGFGNRIHIATIREWFDQPRYIEVLAEIIVAQCAKFPDPGAVHLLYSAHSIPQRLVDEGDPYLEQTRRTVELVNERLGGRYPWTLGFQSRVGPVRWLEPSIHRVIDSLARKGVRQVLVVPVSFVSDHIETLYEIDIFYREIAERAGIPHFGRAPALNDHPKFIEALADLVKRELAVIVPEGSAEPAAHE
jgi:ferrochelatase